MDQRPVCPGHFPDQCMLRQKGLNELRNIMIVFHSLLSNGETLLKGETPRELCMWLSSVSFLALICFLWEAHRLQIVIVHPLCDCSIMCAMLPWMLRSPLSWKLLLIHDYPLIFLSGLNHLLQTCSLFISAANHTSDQDKYGLMHVSWLKQTRTVELQSDGTESEVIRERGFMLSSGSFFKMFQSICQTVNVSWCRQ